ncbi:helix-turn-helix domain-containing protein [Salmonella enterica]|nr:helix-turn-helix domain-containing protein [Salmonella enterica]
MNYEEIDKKKQTKEISPHSSFSIIQGYGMDQASKQGKSIGRPKKTDDNIKKAISMYHKGFKLMEIKNETGISKSTLYRYLESAE